LKKTVKEQFNIELKASLNPRGKKDVTEGLPRGMSLLTPYGEVICQAGHSMEFQGIRFATERFIYGPPTTDSQDTPCLSCADKVQCCPLATQGRMVTIPFDLLPHINPEDPPCAKRFKAIMTRRPAVERMIKRLKRDLSDDRLTKRGNASFQASLDKTMIAFHVQLRQE
jgi:hypothetical protein